MNVISLTTAYMQSHCYLIEEDNHIIIIDPGDSEIAKKIINEMHYVVDFCILTHEHCDHSYGCSSIKEAFGCNIISSENCNVSLMNTRKNFSQYYDAFIEIQTQYPAEEQGRIEPFKTNSDIVFVDEKRIDWMQHQIYLKETPGHSLGSICILIDDSILFSGDTLLLNEPTKTNYPGSNKDDLRQVTIPWLMSLKDGVTVYAGHGESFLLEDRLSKGNIIEEE